MAWDKALERRMRGLLAEMAPNLVANLEEKNMFGGLAFLCGGNLALGLGPWGLVVRVGPQNYQAGLERPFAAQFDITGRPMTGWVQVAPQGLADDETLAGWMAQGLVFAQSLPPKAKSKKP